MRKLKTLSTLLLTLILTFAMSITTFAYNYKDYETRSIYDGSAVIIKSNNPKAINNVVLYMYVDSTDIKIDNNRNFYIFYCKGGEASEGIIYLPLIYEFVPDNKKVYDTLNDNERDIINLVLYSDVNDLNKGNELKYQKKKITKAYIREKLGMKQKKFFDIMQGLK